MSALLLKLQIYIHIIFITQYLDLSTVHKTQAGRPAFDNLAEVCNTS